MIPASALNSNEKYCSRCGGEGRVPSEDAYVSSTATEPRYTGMVDCPDDCADGVVATERRETPRSLMDDQLTRLVNLVSANRDDWRAVFATAWPFAAMGVWLVAGALWTGLPWWVQAVVIASTPTVAIAVVFQHWRGRR